MSRVELPSDVTMEVALIGHMLDQSNSCHLDLSRLEDSHFFDPAHRTIWGAIRELDRSGKSFDVVSVAGKLNDEKKLQEVGGSAKLQEITMGAAILSESIITTHAERLRDLWKARQFIALCQTGAAEMREGGSEQTDEIIRRYDETFANLLVNNDSKGPVRFFDAVKESIQKLAPDAPREPIVSSGYATLDRMTAGGLHSGDLVVIAARPGMGKTAFVLNLMTQVSLRGDAGLIFELEMPLHQVVCRILCSETGVPLKQVRSGQIEDRSWKLLTAAEERLSQMPLWVDDTSGITVSDIRARIRSVKRSLSRVYGESKRLRLVAVDYLQLLRSPKAQNREQEVSAMTRELKALAKEEDVCILVLAQLNRETERDKDHRPKLKDLRESGSIEQDADVVIFLYREGYYDEEADQNLAEIIIAKQRNGPTGMIQMRWDASRVMYLDLDTEHDYVDELADIEGAIDRF